MPSSKNYVRNYRQEYRQSQSSPSEIKRRSSRNKARRLLKKKGRLKLGQDVDHKNTNPLDNSSGNLRMQPASKNRSFKRDKNARKR